MKAGRLIHAAGLAVAAILGGCDDSKGTAMADGVDPRVAQGLAITPVAVTTAGGDSNQIGLGSYLVNAAGACNDCHTQPQYAAGGDPFQGQPGHINTANFLAGGRPFGPAICSRNLTPDAAGLPAGLSSAAFIQEMRSGIDPGTGQLLQVMPWPAYGKLSDDDLKAIYAYLAAIPPAQPPPPGATACIPK